MNKKEAVDCRGYADWWGGIGLEGKDSVSSWASLL